MTKINLRNYYPHYEKDLFIDVPDVVADLLRDFERRDAAYRLRVYRNRAYYSLDVGDGIERSALLVVRTPEELYERKLAMEQLYAAITDLPEKQGKRIYARFFLNMGISEIARFEGVHDSTIRKSIARGLSNLEKLTKYFP